MDKKPSSQRRSNFFTLRPGVADGAALVSGLLLPLAFSPFDWSLLAIICPAFLFLLWSPASPRRAAWRGFLFGLGMFGLGVSWVYVSMHRFGNMPLPLAALATLLFVMGLSLYPALFGWLQARFLNRRHITHTVLVLPAMWVLLEWVRGWFLTGFPWLNVGYSQVAGPLAGYAPVFGVYGVSFFCVLSAGLLAATLHDPKKFWLLFLPPLALVWIGGWLVGNVEWTQALDKPLQVSLIQGNISLESKWRPENRNAILERYLTLSEQAPRSDLIVWPESAIPTYFDTIDSNYLDRLRRLSFERNTDFVIGIVERDADRRRYYNSAVNIGAAGGVYRKHHLVPFGEFLPLQTLFGWLLQTLEIPMSDFSAGPANQPPLLVAGQKVGVSICYEDAFGEEVIRALPQATLLINVSEDAWFGDSLGPHQRVQMARMRARETGRSLLRAANTGPSMVIDAQGKIAALSPQFQAYTLTAMVQPLQGMTPYGRWGNLPIILLLSVVSVIAGIARLAIKRQTSRWRSI
ncbi:MAG: apolipoprotein N-acyltransferase [Gammaproteobacteria bacterium]|nr:apolipoprotein N-acyltransferase [Gammaproteobacteria bacterium]